MSCSTNDAHYPFFSHHTTQCDGKCVICDSYVRPSTLVRICDECTYSTPSSVGLPSLPFPLLSIRLLLLS